MVPEDNADIPGAPQEARVPLQNLAPMGPDLLLGLDFLGYSCSSFLFWDVLSALGWIWEAHNIQFHRSIAAENEACLRSHT